MSKMEDENFFNNTVKRYHEFEKLSFVKTVNGAFKNDVEFQTKIKKLKLLLKKYEYSHDTLKFFNTFSEYQSIYSKKFGKMWIMDPEEYLKGFQNEKH